MSVITAYGDEYTSFNGGSRSMPYIELAARWTGRLPVAHYIVPATPGQNLAAIQLHPFDHLERCRRFVGDGDALRRGGDTAWSCRRPIGSGLMLEYMGDGWFADRIAGEAARLRSPMPFRCANGSVSPTPNSSASQ